MSKSMIEKLKDCSLVALFLSTVLLLSFFWGNISFDGLKFPSEQVGEDIPKTVNLIKPEQILVNFGSDNYTVIPTERSDIWYSGGAECMVREIDRFGQAEDILVKELDYDSFQKVRKHSAASIWAEFSYDLPLSDFCEIFNITEPQSYHSIEAVTVIGYTSAEKKSLFIFDGKNNKYYWLVADANKNDTVTADFPALIASIEAEGYNNSSYYPISTYLGALGEKNDTLIPVTLTANLKRFSYKQDIYAYQTQKINTIAEDFFGGNFDFVRRIIEDSGKVIYMYGYGQNVLIVDTDGSIEYKEELLSGKTKHNFSEALNIAIQFAADHGSWKSLEGSELTPYLKDVVLNPEKEDGYRFVFGMEVNGNRLFYEKGDAIVVNVVSGQVTYYKRNMIDFDQKELEAIETYSPQEVFSSLNLIAQNYQYIYNALQQSGDVEATVEPVFEDVASLVNNMQTGYVRLSDKNITEVKPVWDVTINHTDFFFDLYSAEPIGYSKE